MSRAQNWLPWGGDISRERCEAPMKLIQIIAPRRNICAACEVTAAYGPFVTEAILATVIETLREEHRNIARLLEALDHQVDVFAQAGSPDYDVVSGIAEYFLEYPDLCHHPKEDVVFRRLRETHPQDASKIGDLLGEHRVVHERAGRFRDAVGALLNDTDIARSVVVDAARQFIEAERRHMQKEEEQFLPLAERVLTPVDWSLIEGALSIGRDPLFGARVEEKFARLRERLLAWEQEYRAAPDLSAGVTPESAAS